MSIAPHPLAARRRARAAIILLLASTAAGCASHRARRAAGPLSDADLKRALDVVTEQYHRPVTRAELLAKALGAIAGDLDPYSAYLPESEWGELHVGLEAEFGGIGVVLDDDEEKRIVVRRLLFDGTAAAAGVRAGDLLISIDGELTAGKTLEEVFPRLRGTPGSEVAIELLHPGETTPVLLRVQRAVISQPSVRGARRDSGGRWRDPMLDEREAIGYIRVMREAKDTAAGVATLLQELERRGARGLILDLRDNVGGLRRAAMDVVDLFLDAGPVLEVVGDGKTEVLETRAGGNLDLPMVVLINDGTISAGELIAAALRDRDRAVLVGQRTFGKGMVQRLFPLGEGAGGLTLTVGVHRRLGGRNLEKHGQPEGSEEWGVAPDAGMEVLPEREQDEAQREQMLDRDAPIVPTPEDLAEPALPDPQLERALVVLRQRLAPR